MRKPGILSFLEKIRFQRNCDKYEREEQNAENKLVVSETDVIISPFGQSDFSTKQHKVCTFKWALSKIAISDLYLVFSRTVTNIKQQRLSHRPNLGRQHDLHKSLCNAMLNSTTLNRNRSVFVITPEADYKVQHQLYMLTGQCRLLCYAQHRC